MIYLLFFFPFRLRSVTKPFFLGSIHEQVAITDSRTSICGIFFVFFLYKVVSICLHVEWVEQRFCHTWVKGVGDLERGFP
jgi:hypothetical protein